MSETKTKTATKKRVAVTEKVKLVDAFDKEVKPAAAAVSASRLLKNMRGNPQQLTGTKIVLAHGLVEVNGKKEGEMFVWSDDTKTKLFLSEVDIKRMNCGLETGVWTWAK